MTQAQHNFYNQYATTTIDIDAVWCDRDAMQDARNEHNRIKNEPKVK